MILLVALLTLNCQGYRLYRSVAMPNITTTSSLDIHLAKHCHLCQPAVSYNIPVKGGCNISHFFINKIWPKVKVLCGYPRWLQVQCSVVGSGVINAPSYFGRPVLDSMDVT